MPSSDLPHYRNVMEALVIEELERQMQLLPSDLVDYINPAQVIAFALNRLPPLYATSFDGWQKQEIRAKKQFENQIYLAVRWGLTVVQREPWKGATSLQKINNRLLAKVK